MFLAGRTKGPAPRLTESPRSWLPILNEVGKRRPYLDTEWWAWASNRMLPLDIAYMNTKALNPVGMENWKSADWRGMP